MSGSFQSDYQAGMSVKEADAAAAGGGPVAKLSSNENPFGPSPKAVTAARTALETANIYPERTDAVLAEALAAFHGRDLQPGNFFAANSGVEVLSLFEEALISAGEEAIICPPCFGAYTPSLKNKGAKIVQVPLKDAGYEVDVAGILAAVNPATRLVYLCNPNNPTGTWFGQDVLDAVLDGLPDHVTLIYDEVYFQFATEAGLPDALRHVLDGRNIAIVHSFSKAYGLAGMRLGYGIAPAGIVEKVQKVKRSFHVSTAGLEAGIAALSDTEHLERTVSNNHAERRVLAEGLAALGVAVAPSQANFVMFKCPGGMSAADLTKRLVIHGVMVRPAFFLAGHIRATIGLPEENARLLAALSEILKDQ